MDWYETGQWWLDGTKNGSSKWKSSSGRNRTKVYIYPSYSHSDDVDFIKTSSASSISTTTIRSTTTNRTDEENLVILPGTCNNVTDIFSDVFAS